MKRSTVLIGIGAIILGIAVLGGLSLTGSEPIEKTVPIIESDCRNKKKVHLIT